MFFGVLFFFFNDTPTTEIYTLSYTTLFRSALGSFGLHRSVVSRREVPSTISESRSEEHTSELQSLTNLVCRLLLEKKKKPRTTPNNKKTHKTRRYSVSTY